MSSAAGGRRPGRSQTRRPPRRVGIVSAWIAGALAAAGVIVAALITTLGSRPPTVNVNIGSAGQVTHSASPSETLHPASPSGTLQAAGPSGTSQATGTFTYPTTGVGGLAGPATLTARGTVRNLEHGHHLLIWLQATGKPTYWAGDPDVVVSADGRWSGTVCVDFRGDITLYLVDLNPAGLARLTSDNEALWGGAGMSFPPAQLTSGVRVLDSVSADANGKLSQCGPPPRALY
jgi:hypothetical protein